MCVYVYVCGGRERERGRGGLNFCNAELSPKTGRPAAPGDEWENRSTRGKRPINRTQRKKKKKKNDVRTAGPNPGSRECVPCALSSV